MRPTGGEPVYDPADYRPAFTREHIVEHLREVCEIVEEVDPPAHLAERVFDVAQAMWSSQQSLASLSQESQIVHGNGAMAPALRLKR